MLLIMTAHESWVQRAGPGFRGDLKATQGFLQRAIGKDPVHAYAKSPPGDQGYSADAAPRAVVYVHRNRAQQEKARVKPLPGVCCFAAVEALAAVKSR